MSIGRPKSELVLSQDERIQVSSLARSRTLPHAIVARAKMVLWSAEGASNTEIASRLQWTNATVGKWRRRFIERRLPGLYDELRPGYSGWPDPTQFINAGPILQCESE